jgi:hypothetical protein
MRLLIPCLAAVGLVGCATTYNANWTEPVTAPPPAETQTDALKTAVEEGDALWKERGDKAKLEGAIAKWEAAAATTQDAALFTKISRAHYLLGDGFHALAGNMEQRDSEYQLGLDWATKALKLAAPEFAKSMAEGKKHSESIPLATKEAVPAAYWYATNLGKWAASRGFATRLRYKDDIKATMDHIVKLDEMFFYAAPYRYLGSFEALTAGLAGGSLEKSEVNYKKGVELAPTYLGTKVLWAEFLCVKKQDKAMFKQLLDEVIAANASVDAEIEPENKIEQEKAKKLLARMDEIF